MHIEIWAVGKPHESYVAEGIALFEKRLKHYFPLSWRLIPAAKNQTAPAEIRRSESAAILAALDPQTEVILLDERGTSWTSEELADQLQRRQVNGTKRLVLVIGGAYGVDEHIRTRAQHVWSLSRLVFPHQLTRLILVEQLYRAGTILRNEQYHHP